MSKVVLKRCDSYLSVEAALRDSLGLLGGMEKYVKKGDKVLLKPNLCDPLPPEKAATTHPLVVKAVANLVKQAGGIPIIGECAAGDIQGGTSKAFEICGINQIAEETKSKTRNFQEEEWVLKNISGYVKLRKADFAQALFEVDVIINLPKLKTHGITFITGALKNTFGCVHIKNRKLVHAKLRDKEDFANALLDIYSLVKPNLTIMDGIVAMEGDEGPSFGEPVQTGYLLVSEDAVAVDSIGATLTGHKPMEIPIIRAAKQRGLGQAELKDITLLGDKLEIFPNFKQNTLYKKGKGASFQPFITERCERCNACYTSCPVGAILDSDGKYVIDTTKCIQCLLCHEVCTHNAIKLKSKSPKMKVGTIRLGPECNQECVFCTVAGEQMRKMSTAEVLGQIDIFAQEGVTRVTLTGGEPTLRNDLPEIISHIYMRKMGLDLQTNGTRLANLEYVKQLKESGLSSVLIALHSHKAEISNKLTGSKAYNKTVAGIKNAARLIDNVAISHVINSENYQDLLNFVDFIHKISPKIFFYFGFVRPNGKVLDNKWVVPKLSAIEPYLARTFEKCDQVGIRFEIEGVPLCYMNGFNSNSSEVIRQEWEPHEWVESGERKHEDVHVFIQNELKCKGAQCRVCQLNMKCVGVWREYAQMHGTSELYPVF